MASVIPGLSEAEDYLAAQLEVLRRRDAATFELNSAYYAGSQRLKHIGIAVPDEFRNFTVVVNVPRMAVDEPVRRQKLKSFQRAGSAAADPELREVWEANNLESQSMLVHREARIHGRAFVSVSDPDPSGVPLIQVEDTAAFQAFVDPHTRQIQAAQRYVDDKRQGRSRTLFLPDETIQLRHDSGRGWSVAERSVHGLGQVPVVMFLNKPRALDFEGTSEMADVIPMTDSIARLLTNMQIAAETHAVPSRWVAGVSKGDFVDRDGKPLPAWQAYFTALMATANKDAKFGQFSASDLKNFHESVNSLMAYCAAVLGLPIRYFGQQTVNPAAEGAIRADEARLIANVEGMNRFDGDSWVWVMGLSERFRTGEWPARNSVRALWENPATPTLAERADAMTKLYSQGVVSREGVWDEMGWDEARKDREKAYLAAEAEDPLIERVMRDVRSVPDGAGVGDPVAALGV